MSSKVAISACLAGRCCRYDGASNSDRALLQKLANCEVVTFCPEGYAFGTPRPTMDLVEGDNGLMAQCNKSGKDLSEAIVEYAKQFFNKHPKIDLVIGKDRSPSCGCGNTKRYSIKKELLAQDANGLFIQEALNRGIRCVGSEAFMAEDVAF